ncbi:MAG: hypothetical protein LBH40_03000 [Alphaproteobacteria bacterium]|jgi:hypothetical protein|nr:hypothetical protein [Alphaproteobacteria bacterium]
MTKQVEEKQVEELQPLTLEFIQQYEDTDLYEINSLFIDDIKALHNFLENYKNETINVNEVSSLLNSIVVAYNYRNNQLYDTAENLDKE